MIFSLPVKPFLLFNLIQCVAAFMNHGRLMLSDSSVNQARRL